MESHLNGIQQNKLRNFSSRGKEKESIKILKNSYKELIVKSVYETFDFAEFLKNNEEFKDSIKYYTKILNEIDKVIHFIPRLPTEEVSHMRGPESGIKQKKIF